MNYIVDEYQKFLDEYRKFLNEPLLLNGLCCGTSHHFSFNL